MSQQKAIVERAELDDITLARAVPVFYDAAGPGFETDKVMPAGSRGTIMLVLQNGGYEVEFVRPFAALATVLEEEIFCSGPTAWCP